MTLIAWGAMWHEADQAAREAEAEGIDCEVLDLRSLQPLDLDAIVASVAKTGRAVVVHEAPRTCGFGAELVALVQERCFLHLEAPIARVTGFDTPFPYTLEMEYLPRAPRILKAIREVVAYCSAGRPPCRTSSSSPTSARASSRRRCSAGSSRRATRSRRISRSSR